MKMKATYVWFITILLKLGSAVELYLTPQNAFGVKGGKATFSLDVNLTWPFTTLTMKSLVVKSPKDSTIASGGGDFFTAVTDNPPFYERLKTKFSKDNNNFFTFEMEVQRINFTDDLTVNAFLEYYINNTLNVGRKNISIPLQVWGGPELCGDSFIKNTTFSNATGNVVSVTLCGNQRPTVVWRVEGKNLDSTNITQGKSHKHEHTYTLNLPTLTYASCQAVMFYIATGYGKNFTEIASVNVDFPPEPPELIHAYQDSGCVYVKWKKQSTGGCEALNYTVRIERTGKPARDFTLSDSNEQSLCWSGDTNDVITGDVFLSSTFGNKTGEVLGVVIQPTPPVTVATTLPPTIAPVTTPEQEELKDDANKTGMVVGIAVGVGVPLILLIIIFYCCCCRDKKAEKCAEGGKETAMEEISPQMKNNPPKKGAPSIYEYSTPTMENEGKVATILRTPSSAGEAANTQAKPAETDANGIKYYDPAEFDLKPQNGPKYSQVNKSEDQEKMGENQKNKSGNQVDMKENQENKAGANENRAFESDNNNVVFDETFPPEEI